MTETGTEDFSQPILPGEAPTDYERYLRTDELLALQKTPDEWVHRDELLFQVVHQSSELWLKLAWNEVEAAGEHVRAGEIGAALRLLRRAALCLRYATDQLDMLEQMSPWEYQEIRRVLGHGSGFDSPGFRELRRVAPRLGEAFHGALDAAGLSARRRLRPRARARGAVPARRGAVELDERITVWRVRHFKTSPESSGTRSIGTQGTPVEVLGRLIHKVFYPELWEARNELTALSKLT